MTPFEAWYEGVRTLPRACRPVVSAGLARRLAQRPRCPECLRNLAPPYRSCLKCGWVEGVDQWGAA